MEWNVTPAGIAKHQRVGRRIRALRRLAADSGIAFELLVRKSTEQLDHCPICRLSLPVWPQADLNDAGELRGVLCKVCHTFVQRYGENPISAPTVKYRPYRKLNAMQYLGAIKVDGAPPRRFLYVVWNHFEGPVVAYEIGAENHEQAMAQAREHAAVIPEAEITLTQLCLDYEIGLEPNAR